MSTEKEAKLKALQLTLDKLDKTYGKGAVMKLGDKEGGTKHFIIEQEAYQGLQPLDCMKENIAIMRGWGYK